MAAAYPLGSHGEHIFLSMTLPHKIIRRRTQSIAKITSDLNKYRKIRMLIGPETATHKSTDLIKTERRMHFVLNKDRLFQNFDKNFVLRFSRVQPNARMGQLLMILFYDSHLYIWVNCKKVVPCPLRTKTGS